MDKASLNRTAASATLHCLTGCAIGEVMGMVIGSAFGLHGAATVIISIVLAFVFGYGLSLLPLLKAGPALKAAMPLVLASDSLSIATMEIADNAVVIAIPGALNAGLSSALFWLSLAFSLAVAYCVAFPVNRYLLSKGKGHALLHGHHHSRRHKR